MTTTIMVFTTQNYEWVYNPVTLVWDWAHVPVIEKAPTCHRRSTTRLENVQPVSYIPTPIATTPISYVPTPIVMTPVSPMTEKMENTIEKIGNTTGNMGKITEKINK